VHVEPEAVPPDPYALVELAHDVRSPDYARSFARAAGALAVAVPAASRPPWLAAVAAEPGVEELAVADALARFAAR